MAKKDKYKKTERFMATGLVFGETWDRLEAMYPIHVLRFDTKKLLIFTANEMLEDGTLDSGFGFKSLRGALLHICKITTIIVDGKPYENKEYEYDFIGDLSPEEKEILCKAFSEV